MGGKIFLSYRREDASANARSIYQRLAATFGREKLFIDVDTIDKGRDFRQVLDRDLNQCSVLIAVIGPKWATVTDDKGKRRIDSSGDFVRLEIARALAKDVVVIPTLVDGAAMPQESELPADLKTLVYRQSAMVRHETFGPDMTALEQDIRKHVPANRARPWKAALAVAGTLGLVALAGFLALETGLPFLNSNAARDRDIASVIERCVKLPVHPEKAEIAADIATKLASKAYEYGWVPATEGGGPEPAMQWKTVTAVSAKDGEIKLNYDWRNGRLRLLPVIERRYATRSIAVNRPAPNMAGQVSVAAVLQGAWSQNNGYGCIELWVDDDGNAKGRWGVATSDSYDADAHLRLKP